ncbi:hypothetical protein [Butyricicoccus pullicaecorum]|uniref:Uncharacterized protein n=1 Tax=Butyricicoccus pullicaecorum TaxID=501571 RepID=A0A1Y4L505_9FIRM|nr:hypothetical protein [Butyricicoccus pullicaecorum]OUP51857.1 hypothetical protein B5F17_11455 [Butyricicoccus pullicaecorum]OUP58766.1 hypothetical protein B5F15_07105 [Butyricicoccus pullicaecorum]HJF52915.1 hypothetical protein [Butyricicoccus pullicaecorum]
MLESNLDRTLGMTDEEMTLRFRKAVDLEKQLKIARGEPIARFDKATGKVFLEYPDGRREYV